MSQKEKLLARLKSQPIDFTFDEAESLLRYYGYHRNNKGRTSGSRVMFASNDSQARILLHKPHPGNVLKGYQIRQIIDFLMQEGLL